MKILNLVYPEKSDIKYQVQKFPDGQQNIKLIDVPGIFPVYDIIIKSWLNNWSDLELICCANAALKRTVNERYVRTSLMVPYFLGARSDRPFGVGTNNYLKDVIAPVINNQNFAYVQVYDAHSDVLEAVIDRLTIHDNEFLVKWALNDLYKDSPDKYPCILVSPDAGASKKIYKLAEQIGYKGDIITCSKNRDKNGNLTYIDVPIENTELDKDIIIIDDICDGGATFNNISAALNDAGHKGKKYLIVTHGIFSKGFRELSMYFDGIYTTNSYKDQTRPGFETDKEQNLIKQLNVY